MNINFTITKFTYNFNNIYSNLITNIIEVLINLIQKFSVTNILNDYNPTTISNNPTTDVSGENLDNKEKKVRKSRVSNKYPIAKPTVKKDGKRGAPTKAEKEAYKVALEQWENNKKVWEENNKNIDKNYDNKDNNNNNDDDKSGSTSSSNKYFF